ncbi:hypothetical protein D9619_005731 [Psilocybe cf. subviscida]|uniref:Methyltransferase type 11 domain-containing protein n=1 Tax=Psilocybe cf. subviscida TaxID=2480587 RepID=A0A8H5BX43_9AGAR|nr:hypothetical protein D9619_005731 [Psilocybe cf. subviscida]
MTTTVHQVAQSGFGTGTNELYDRIRPTYQPFALDYIRDSIKEQGPLKIVEIGAGTGIFTRAILADQEWNKRLQTLKAIEPSEGMREVFVSKVVDPRISCAHGTFDDTGVEDGWADLVVIAQAFHWCPDYDKASAEFARVLKPNGIVAFIWNLEDRDGAQWVAQLRDLIEEHEQGTPQFRHGYWRATFVTPSYKAHFESPQEENWSYTIAGSKEGAVDRASSKSYVAVLPVDKKKEVQDAIRKIVDEDQQRVWIDKSQGIFEYPYKAYVVIAQKKQ